jgi:hypothetical protein
MLAGSMKEDTTLINGPDWARSWEHESNLENAKEALKKNSTPNTLTPYRPVPDVGNLRRSDDNRSTLSTDSLMGFLRSFGEALWDSYPKAAHRHSTVEEQERRKKHASGRGKG